MTIQILLGGSTSALSGSAVPANVSGYSLTYPATVTSGTCTASGSGGTGSYTYEWEYVGGDVLEFVNPTNSPTQAWRAYIPNQAQFTGTYRCKISDGISTVYTNNVTVTLSTGTPL